jgi:peptidyl-prolyl cis-trans isomerase D
MIRGGQRWLTALFVIGVGGVFVFFLGLQGPLDLRSSGTIAKVGPYDFGIREFERARERRAATLQERFGEQFDASALSDTLDQMAVRQLVDQALLALEAEALGLAVGKREIEQIVLADPGFRDESGRFDRENFEDYVDYAYGSQASFIEERRLALLSYKMIRLLNSQPRISDGEVRAAARQQLEQVRLAFVALGGGDADPEAVEAAEVERALSERLEEVQALYDERSAEFNVPERVRARHILFAIPSEADAGAVAEVRERAEAALARAREGEDFAALASELSEDVGTQGKGGDLGFFGRGQMVGPFEEAAFDLEVGAISEPVQSPFGFHLIKVEERQAAVHRPFDSVREPLVRELLATELARRESRELAEAIAADVRAGRSLEEAARARELTLERSGFLGRRPDGFVPGLGPAPELLAASFALDPGQSSPGIFESGDKLALVQLLERKEPDPQEVEARMQSLRPALLDEKRMARADAWLNARREQLVADGDLSVDLDSLR